MNFGQATVWACQRIAHAHGVGGILGGTLKAYHAQEAVSGRCGFSPPRPAVRDLTAACPNGRSGLLAAVAMLHGEQTASCPPRRHQKKMPRTPVTSGAWWVTLRRCGPGRSPRRPPRRHHRAHCQPGPRRCYQPRHHPTFAGVPAASQCPPATARPRGPYRPS